MLNGSRQKLSNPMNNSQKVTKYHKDNYTLEYWNIHRTNESEAKF